MRWLRDVLVPTPVGIVSTLFGDCSMDVVNLTPVTWFMPVSYSPPIVAVSMKPANDGLLNLKETREFVLQLVPFGMAQVVHNCAKKFPREVSEAEEFSLEIVKSDAVGVGRLKEALQWVECKVVQVQEWGDHCLVIAQVVAQSPPSDPYKQVLLYSDNLLYCSSCAPVRVEPY